MDQIDFKVTLELSIGPNVTDYTRAQRMPTAEELEQIVERLTGDLEYYVHESDMLINFLDDVQPDPTDG